MYRPSLAILLAVDVFIDAKVGDDPTEATATELYAAASPNNVPEELLNQLPTGSTRFSAARVTVAVVVGI